MFGAHVQDSWLHVLGYPLLDSLGIPSSLVQVFYRGQVMFKARPSVP